MTSLLLAFCGRDLGLLQASCS